jgi:hypothetical protein
MAASPDGSSAIRTKFSAVSLAGQQQKGGKYTPLFTSAPSRLGLLKSSKTIRARSTPAKEKT